MQKWQVFPQNLPLLLSNLHLHHSRCCLNPFDTLGDAVSNAAAAARIKMTRNSLWRLLCSCRRGRQDCWAMHFSCCDHWQGIWLSVCDGVVAAEGGDAVTVIAVTAADNDAIAAVGKDPDAVTGNHDVAAGVYSPTMTQLRMQSMMQLFLFLGSSLYIVMTTVFPWKRTNVALGRCVLHSWRYMTLMVLLAWHLWRMVWSGVDLTLLDIKWRSCALLPRPKKWHNCQQSSFI